MHYFRAFNLNIASAAPLPELQPGSPSSPVDLFVSIGAVNSANISLDQTAFWWNGDTAHFHWPHTGTFAVRQGRSIVFAPTHGALENLWRLPLLGGVMAMALHQRGLLVLHASAVSVHGHAVVFIGEKGRGKSTTAAALFHRGHQLLADDVVAIELGEGAPMVLPAVPQFRLWPDAASWLGDDPEGLPRIHVECEKRTRNAHESFSELSIPLRKIFVLGEGPECRITPIGPQDILKQLLTHSYCSRYGRTMMSPQAGGDHFRRCLSVAQSVTVELLERPRSLPLIDDMAKVIEVTMRLDSGRVDELASSVLS